MENGIRKTGPMFKSNEYAVINTIKSCRYVKENYSSYFSLPMDLNTHVTVNGDQRGFQRLISVAGRLQGKCRFCDERQQLR